MTEQTMEAVSRFRGTIDPELQQRVSEMRALWVNDGRPEYQFWAVMMGVFAGKWPGGPES